MMRGLKVVLLLFLLILVDSATAYGADSTVSIKSGQDLVSFIESVNNGEDYEGITVRLESDIVYEGELSADRGSSFSGIFDGDNHSIRGVNGSLFDTVKGVVKDVVIKDSDCGLFVYSNYGLIDNVRVINSKFSNGFIYENWGRVWCCQVDADVNVSGDKGFGLVFCNYTGGTILNSSFTGSFSGGSVIADIVFNNKGFVNNCWSIGVATSGSSSHSAIAYENIGRIINCYGVIGNALNLCNTRIEDSNRMIPKSLVNTQAFVKVLNSQFIIFPDWIVGTEYPVIKTVYSVHINTVVNGTVRITPAFVGVGEVVGINAVPDKGYKVDYIIVNTLDGKMIPVFGNIFIMPNKDVAVTVSFVKINYKIKVVKLKYGSIKVKKISDNSVDVLIKCKKGYKIKSVIVKDVSNNKIAVKRIKSGRYNFSMPYSDVKVIVKFKR